MSRSAITPRLLGVVVATTLLCAALLFVFPETDSTIRWQHFEVAELLPQSPPSRIEERSNGDRSPKLHVGTSRSRAFAVVNSSRPIGTDERGVLRSQVTAAANARIKVTPPLEEADLWFYDEPEGKLLLALMPTVRLRR